MSLKLKEVGGGDSLGCLDLQSVSLSTHFLCESRTFMSQAKICLVSTCALRTEKRSPDGEGEERPVKYVFLQAIDE